MQIENTYTASYSWDGTKMCIGGFAGINAGTIENCFIKGLLSSSLSAANRPTSDKNSIGGVVGYNQNGGIVASNSVETSIVHTVKDADGYNCIGGIVGINNATVKTSLFLGSISGTNIDSAMAISALEESNAVTNKCYKSSYVTVSGGSSASPSTLNNKSFYTDTLGWDDSIWNLNYLDFEMGLYPKLY